MIQRAEDIREKGLLRGQGKAKTKKSRNGRKCAFGHERILGQKVPSASEILTRERDPAFAKSYGVAGTTDALGHGLPL